MLDRVRHVLRRKPSALRKPLPARGAALSSFHQKRHPQELGLPAVAAVLADLAVPHQIAASTQTQALRAPLFRYAEVLQQPPIEPLTRDARESDLRGQRDGVLLAVDAADDSHIV